MRTIKTAAIVEDGREDRFFLRRMLGKVFPDCEVHEFPYAEEALTFLKSPDRARLDVIFVDINMPRMDGFEFADCYQELYPELKGQTQLYVVSSSINPDDRVRVEEHPAIVGFFEKPVSRDALAAL